MTDIGATTSNGGEPSVLGPTYATSPATTFAASVFSAKGPAEMAKAITGVAQSLQKVQGALQTLGSSGASYLDRLLQRMDALVQKSKTAATSVKSIGQSQSSANVLNNGGWGNMPQPFQPMTPYGIGGTSNKRSVPSLQGGGWAPMPPSGTPPTVPPTNPDGTTPGGSMPPTFGQIRWGQLATGVGVTAAAGLGRTASGMMGDLQASNLAANQFAFMQPGAYSNGQTRAALNWINRSGLTGFNSFADLSTGLLSSAQAFGTTRGAPTFGQVSQNLQALAILNPGLGYQGASQAQAQMYSPQNLMMWRAVGLPTPLTPGGGQRSFGQLVQEVFRNRSGGALTTSQIVAGQQTGSNLQSNVAALFGPAGTPQYDAAYRYALANAKWQTTHPGQNIDTNNPAQMKAAGLDDTVIRAAQQKQEGVSHLQADSYNTLAKSVQVFDVAVGKFASAVAGSPLGTVGGGALGGLMGGAKNITGLLGPLGMAAQAFQMFKLGQIIKGAGGATGEAAGAGEAAGTLPELFGPGVAGLGAAGAGLGGGTLGALGAGLGTAATGLILGKVASTQVNKALGIGKYGLGGKPGSSHGFWGEIWNGQWSRHIPKLPLIGDGPGPSRGDGSAPTGQSSGDTISQLEKLVSSLGLPYQVTSTYRPGGNSYHARHEAIDIVAGSGPDSPEMMALDKAIASKYGKGLSELIHAGPGAINIKDGKVVDGVGFYGASTMSQHHNHVHVAASPQQLQGAGGISGLPATNGQSSGSTAASAPSMSGFLSEGNTTSESNILSGLFSSSVGVSSGSQTTSSNGGSQSSGNNGGQGVSSILSGAAPKPKVPVPANVAAWINQALQIAGVDQKYAADVGTIISYEDTSFDTGVRNNWDSNAAIGQNSVGLMQVIPSTFAAHSMPGHSDITNPVDNIIAGVRYAIGRYGSLDNVPGLVALRQGKGYVGYATGAYDIEQDQLAQLHRGEMVVPKGAADMVRSSNPQVSFGGRTLNNGGITIQQLTINCVQATADEAKRLATMVMQELQHQQRLQTVGGR